MAAKQPLRIPWMYLGGYLAFFIGLALSLVGSWELPAALRGEPSPFGDPLTVLGLLGLGVACFCLGCVLMARSEPIQGAHMPALIVCFIMTPLPMVIGLGINHLGTYLRKSAGGSLRAVVLGVGVFLLGLGGSWLWEGHHLAMTRQDYREICWIFLIDFGVAFLFLAALPSPGSNPEATGPAGGDVAPAAGR